MKSELEHTHPAYTAPRPEAVQTITTTTGILTISVPAAQPAVTLGSTPRTPATRGADHV